MAEAAKRQRSGEAPSEPTHGQGGAVCTVGFCPICLAVTAVQPIKPEAIEHLLNAGREFLMAMTAVLGARADDTDGREPSPRLTRIDIE
jgi:hypothetical protein